MANIDGNYVPGVSSAKRENYEKIRDHEFRLILVEDREELRRFWSSAVLPRIDPSVAILIDLDFQIGELN